MDRVLACCLCLALIGLSAGAAAGPSHAAECDTAPTGVETQDYRLHFEVPPGLMPDPQFDGRPASLEVHRVRPVYAAKCEDVPSRAAVFIHGRVVTGPVAFDLRYPAPGGGTLSVQEALAWAGIDTFAPSLLGYGRSTTFQTGLDDPGNASLRPYATGGTCPNAEGCDDSSNPVFHLDQQGAEIITNPLGGQRLPHTSAMRFAGTDVWVRDIRQVLEDAIARAQPTDGKVTLVGYSLGAQRVGRALYGAKFPEITQRVNRVAFLSPIFGGPTEETMPAGGFVTFPLSLSERSEVVDSDRMPNAERDAVCAGHRVEGSTDYAWAQLMDHDVVGRAWGGTDPGHPAGMLRSPTSSSYGWNTDVAAQLVPPTLVMQGLDDTGIPGGASNAPAIYDSLPTSMTAKVLVQLDCATHAMMWDGCSNASRCIPASGIPYGGVPDRPWAGPHSTIKAALIEWITSGTFDRASIGTFIVDASGVSRPQRA
jgi:hypothetical protein